MYVTPRGGQSLAASRSVTMSSPGSPSRPAMCAVVVLTAALVARLLPQLIPSLAVFGFALVIVRAVQMFLQLFKLPPGPWGMPIFGYLPFLRSDVHLQFSELASKYGSLFSTQLGNQLIVVLTDHRVIRDAFRREEFTGRPHTEFSNILGGYGIVNSEGKLWKEQRKFLHERLRHFGMTYFGSGKESMERRIMAELENCLSHIAHQRGAPIDMNPVLALPISNIICSILMGVKFQPDDSRFKRFMDLIDEGFRLFGILTYVNFIPAMRYLPGLQATQKLLSRNRTEMAAFFQETIDEHRRTFDRSNIRDVVDAYLVEFEDAEAEGTTLYEGKDLDRQVQQIIGDLFTAGMETIKTTLQWAIVYMLHHPEAAKAVQEELDQVVGRNRLPTLEDVPYLPLTEATLLEIMRRSSIVPMGTTHATTKDINMNGYHIPKHAHIVPLLHSVHMDENLWDAPTEFRPSRFLNAEGKVTKPEYFLPFGVGRRMCLGDVLARMELFLFFSSLLHMNHLRLPEGQNLPSLRGNTGVTITPDSFKVSFIQREVGSDLQHLQCAEALRKEGSH